MLRKTLAEPSAEPANLFATLAHYPLLLRRVTALGGLFLAHGTLTPRERELVILRVAWWSNSRYEWSHHVVLGRKAGLSDEEISRLETRELNEWAEDDRSLITAVDEFIQDNDLTDEVWGVLALRYSREQLMELMMMIGFYRMLAGFLRSVRVQLDMDL